MGRFGTAWKAFWAIWGSAERRQQWQTLVAGQAGETEKQKALPPPQVEEDEPGISADAVYTLALLQREGRLIDFLLEDIDQYADAQVGAAVRQIHTNCRKVLDRNFGVAPVREESENQSVEIPDSFDPRHIRLLGKPSGNPPFKGTLKHHGWRVTKVDFPQRHEKLDPAVICPAEVEVR